MAVFNLDLAKAPERRSFRNVPANDWAQIVESITGLLDSDVIKQAAFTAKVSASDLDSASTTVQRVIGTVASGTGSIVGSVLTFQFTPAETAKLVSANTFDIQIWVQRGSTTYVRTVIVGTVVAVPDITNTTTLALPGSTITIGGALPLTGAPGAEFQLSATVKDSGNNILSGVSVTWTSSNPLVASVDQTGYVRFWTNGACTITASSAVYAISAFVAATVSDPLYVAATAGMVPTLRNGVWTPENPDTRYLRVGVQTGLHLVSPIVDSGGLLISSGGFDVTGASTFRSPVILAGSPGGAGPTVRYIGMGGSTDLMYFNTPTTTGSYQWAVGEVQMMRLTSTGALVVANQVTVTAGGLIVSAGLVNFTAGDVTIGTSGPIATIRLSDAIITKQSGSGFQFNSGITATSLTSSGGVTSGGLTVTTAAGNSRGILLQTGGVNRWFINATNATESGSNAGSGFAINAYDDVGSFIDTPFQITRAVGGAISVTRTLASTVASTGTAAHNVAVAGDTNARLQLMGNGSIFWGPGNAAADVNIGRSGVGALLLTGTLSTTGNLTVQAGGLTVSAGATTFGGSVTIQNGSNFTLTGVLVQSAAVGTERATYIQTNATMRWRVGAGTSAETGSNAGTPYSVQAYDDVGSFIDTPFQIARASGGTITLGRPVTVSGAAATNRSLGFATAGVQRWLFYANSGAESGADAGSDLNLQAYSDTGVGLGVVVGITRAANGVVTVNRPLTVANGTLAMYPTAGSAAFFMNNPLAGNSITVTGQVNGLNRWTLRLKDNAAETGGNAGSNFGINSYDDNGALIDTPVQIIRAAGGAIALSRNVLVGLNAGPVISFGLNSAAGNQKDIQFQVGGLLRWVIRCDSSAETGSNAGSGFSIIARDDTGVGIDTPVFIGRAVTSSIQITRALSMVVASTSAQVFLNSPVGTASQIIASTSGVNRWVLSLRDGSAETGSNVGSNFQLSARDDAGTVIDSPIFISRPAGGTITLSRPVLHSSTVGFNGTAPIAKPALPIAAVDAATTQTLANAIRTVLINYGLTS